LRPSERIGPYEILGEVGAGGMGQVYRARDTRLNRVVAIKVLLPDIDPGFEQSRRFEREAQAIAALNHPHICAVHDVGNENGTPYLVMEYLEGETLAARLSRGPLPLSQALRCAAEISDALDKAHLAGVVHRDVKPSNIVFTPGGAKLLDFGIAKRMAVAGIESSDTFTTSSHLTQHGAVVGTLQYMAPEQVRGEEADARTDIFAFGAVLYEMVSGVKAFKAQTPTDLMVAILEHEPPRMTTLQRHVPAALERIVRVCLEKDPSDRWQSARDVTLQLRDVAAAPVIPEARAVSTRPWWILPALGLVGLVLLTAAASIYRPRPAEPPDLEFTIAPPQNSLSRMQLDPFTTVSPDGRQVAYTVRTENRPTQLWVQSLNSPDPRMLPGTDGGYIPFWSPDSTQVGFFTTDGELKAVTLADGSIRLLCKVADPLGGTWNRDGTVLFSTAATSIYTDTSVPTSGLHRISQTGGTPTLVKTAYKSGTDSRRPISRTYGAREGWPRFLPDGRHFLFLDRGTMTIQIGTLESSETTSLLPSDSQAIYARGHLLFVREGTLMAQQFDVEKLELRGEAFRVAENVRFDAVLGGAVFSASDGGALAYSQGSALGSTRQTWLDGAGRPSADLPSVMLSPQGGIRLSPDDDRIAQARLLPGQLSDIWVVGLARGQGRPVTLGPAAETNPVWSPNGVHLVYASNENGVFDLYKIAASGSGAPEVVYKSAYDKFPLDWSMDGRFIAFMERNPKTRADILVLDLKQKGDPLSAASTEATEDQARFSYDGKWLAYRSNESGRTEIYVKPMAGGDPIQVSSDGGRVPFWRHDSQRLFFVSMNNSLMAVDLGTDKGFRDSVPTQVFRLPATTCPTCNSLELTKDGRFLLSSGEWAFQSPMRIRTNWLRAVNRSSDQK